MEGLKGDGEHAQSAVRGMTEEADSDVTLTRAVFFLQAAENNKWDFVMDMLPHIASLHARDAVFLVAAQQRRWVVAGKLLYMGVSPETRNDVFSDVVDDGDVWLCSNLITAGVSPDFQDRALRRAIELGRVSFVVELLRLTVVNSIAAFVLEAAISLENWTLVFEVVKIHEELQLSAELMDAACRAAGRGLQWLALFVDIRGTQQIQEIVDVVLRPGPDMIERFLGIFPREAMPSSVKTILIKGVIVLDRSDGLREVLCCHGASKQETMEAFDSAVSCRNEEALQVLVSYANRNSHLLKQFCATNSDVYSPENFAWICQTLKGRHLVLSFDIALAANNRDFVEHVVLSDETNRKVRRMFLQKVCANSQDLFREIAEKLVVRYPQYRRTLFLMSVRQGYHSVALALDGQGVSLRDRKYAIRVAVANGDYATLGFISDVTGVLRSKLLQGFVRKSLNYFVSRGESDAEFLYWFERYCKGEEAGANFVVSVFRRVYKAAVRWDSEICFVKSISLVVEFSGKERRKVAETICQRATTAHNDQVSDTDIRKVVPAIDFALKKQQFRFVSRMLFEDSDELITCVLKRAFRKRAWPVFDTLFEIQSETEDPYFPSYGKVFKHCLSRTVAKASNTVTVGDIDAIPTGASDTQTVGASDTGTVGASAKRTAEVSDTGTVEISDTQIVGAVGMLNKWLENMCPVWDEWLEWDNPGCVLTRTLGSDWRLSKRSGAVLRLAEFSSRHACHGLALFLAAVLGAEGRELMEHVVASHLDFVDRNLVLELACYAVQSLNNPAAAAVLLKNLPLSASSSDHSCMEDDTKHLCQILTCEASSEGVVDELKKENAHRWVLVCQLVVKDFTEAEKTLTLCNSQECVDVVVQYAASCSRADVVCRHASETSGPEFLEWLLSEELINRRKGNVGAVRCLLNLIGTSAGDNSHTGSYLSDVCHGLSYRPREARELARCLVSLGASAQHRRQKGEGKCSLCPLCVRECPLTRASDGGELQLVELFHRSGVCSNQRLFQLAEATHSDSNRSNYDIEKALIQSYLTFAARSPLSLQDLCRNAVSSSLGGRPGYLQRVQALSVPALVKEFILFSDFTQEESAELTE